METTITVGGGGGGGGAKQSFSGRVVVGRVVVR